ncbi:MAG: zf-HC2 domain-containing protein [Lentisphaerota bacterium]
MNCEKISIMMTDLLAGEISEKDKAVLESHIAACGSCKQEFEELKAVWALTENALKADFFDDSLKPENYKNILSQKSSTDIPVCDSSSPKMTPSTSKPKKFMWLEIAASIIVCVFIAALLLPSLTMSREKARRISTKNEMNQIGLGIKMFSKEASPSAPKSEMTVNQPQLMPAIPEEKPTNIYKIAGAESKPGRSRVIATDKEVSKSGVVLGEELQKGRRQISD